MLEGSEFQTVRVAIVKPWKIKVVWTQGTDNRLE